MPTASDFRVQNFSLRNKSAAGGCRVLLVATRSQIRGVSVRVPDSVALDSVLFSPLGIEAKWSPPIRPETEIILSIHSSGEPVDLLRSAWSDESGDFQVSSPEGAVEPLAATGDAVETFRRATLALESARGQPVPGEDPLLQTARDFFADYDAQTNPQLFKASTVLNGPQKSEREKDIRGVALTLRKRVIERTLAQEGQSRRLHPDVLSVQRLSFLQLQLYLKHYPAPDGRDLDVESISRAFLLFANGSLRDQSGSEHGQPNSADVFSFAEFGFLACEMNIDAGDWKAVLPALVAMQSVYVDVYKPHHDPPWRWDEFLASNFCPNAMLRVEQIEERLKAIERVEPDLRATANAGDAFKGGFFR